MYGLFHDFCLKNNLATKGKFEMYIAFMLLKREFFIFDTQQADELQWNQ